MVYFIAGMNDIFYSCKIMTPLHFRANIVLFYRIGSKIFFDLQSILSHLWKTQTAQIVRQSNATVQQFVGFVTMIIYL